MERMRKALSFQLQSVSRLQAATIASDPEEHQSAQRIIGAARRTREKTFQDFRGHLLTEHSSDSERFSEPSYA
jgi:hypothetical protein